MTGGDRLTSRHDRLTCLQLGRESRIKLDDRALFSVLGGVQELGMTIKASKKAWTKPSVRRLGKISDVAGAQGAGTQGAGAKT